MMRIYSASNVNNKKIPTKKVVTRKPKIDRTQNANVDKSKIKIGLTKHDAVSFSPEYFSYLNSNGEDVKFNGLIITDTDGSYIGKQVLSHKVSLNYHPKVNSVRYSEEYFSYVDEYGNVKKFTGTPEFDLESNSYFGLIIENVLTDKIIDIFKEEEI